MKKLLGKFIVWHRLLALPSCIFFGIWFVSGIVMIYARMPALTEADRLANLPALNLSTAQPISRPIEPAPQRILLRTLNGRPVYNILPQQGNWYSLYADDGSPVGELNTAQAIAAAAAFRNSTPTKLTSEALIHERDQWTVYPSSRVYLPFHIIRANDPPDTKYYVSATTGSIYMVTTLRGRILAWCGAIPHWWYITALRSNNSLWHWVLIIASAWGTIMCAFGIAAGFMRYSPSKRYRFPSGKSSIPHVGTKRWHYILGYGFGFITFTWIFSGMMSMNPGNWSPGPEPSLAETQAFAGAPLDTRAFTISPRQAWAALNQCLHPKEIELILFNGQPYYLGRESPSNARLLPANSPSPTCLTQVPLPQIQSASHNLASGAPIVATDTLTAYDSYYYDRDHLKPLPVVRIRLADPNQTWLYVNPQTALILARYTTRSRWERWLYNGLHSLDFPILFYHRPLWDIIVIVFSIGGLALSLTGILLTARYLKKSTKKRRTKSNLQGRPMGLNRTTLNE